MTDVLPVLYLNGLSTGDFGPALRDLLGEDASGLCDRGMSEPKLVTGDGALGAWAALREVFPNATEQRCWVHKTANVLDSLPKRLQPRAKSMLHEMAEAPSRADARKTRERFRSEFDAKYPRAVAKLDKDWDALTAFFDFPAEQWRHLRTTNPIESSFATVKLRTKVTKGAGSKKAALAMAYKLLDAAQERWRRFNGRDTRSCTPPAHGRAMFARRSTIATELSDAVELPDWPQNVRWSIIDRTVCEHL